MMPDGNAVAQAGDRGGELVRAAAERLKVAAGFRHIRGLVEPASAVHQNLVGADDDCIRHSDPVRLGFGQQQRRVAGIGPVLARGQFDDLLVHAWGLSRETQPRRGQQSLASRRSAGQDQLGLGRLDQAVVCLRCRRCQASINCSTVAAVSSIERRVTSITGQPRRVQRRRAQSSSAFTDSWST